MTVILETRKLTKAYRGVPAIKEVDFELQAGEIHALVGENGAGKSTLTKMMAGAVVASSGKLLYRGQEVSFATPSEALNAGIAMVFQETSLVPSMTVAQNLYLGQEKFLTVCAASTSPPSNSCSRSTSRSIPPPSSPASAPPRSRWWRSPAPCSTRPRSSSSTSRPRP